MGKGMFSKMADFVFGSTTDEDDFEEMNYAEEEPAPEPVRRSQVSSAQTRKASSAPAPKVVNFAATTQLKVVVLKLNAFDDSCRQVVDNFNNNKPVIINIEDMERDQARRTIDFISGAAYARRGTFQKVSDGILLLTPSNVDVTPAVKSEIENGRPFPWD